MGKSKVERHLRKKSKSGKEAESVCQWCKTTFPSFEKHINSHTCLPYRCSLCNEGFKQEFQLIKHKKSDHDNASSKSIKETDNPLPGKLHLPTGHVSPDGKRTCKMCKKKLRGRHQFCTSCVSPTNKDTDENLSDENSIISSSILSSSNRSSPLYDKTTKSGNLLRCRRRTSSSNIYEVSRFSDSTEIKRNEVAEHPINNEKRESPSVLHGITTSHESPSRRSRRTDRFRSNSSEISRRSESLDAEDSDAVNNKYEASITSSLNKIILVEKLSGNRHKRATIRLDNSEVCEHSESVEMQNTEGAIEDGAHDGKEKDTDDALNMKEKETTKSISNKTKKSGNVLRCISKQSDVSSDTSDVYIQSESVEPMTSEGAVSSGCLDANETKSTEPLPNKTTVVKNTVAHNHKRLGKPSGNPQISNKAQDADPLETQKLGDPISSYTVNGEPVQKPTVQHEEEETVTGNDLHKTASVFTNSFQPMEKSGNSIFRTKNMSQKPVKLLTSESRESCPESNSNETTSMSLKSLKQVKNSLLSENVHTSDTVSGLPSHKSSEGLIDLESGTVATISEVNKPATVFAKPKCVRLLKNEQSQREQNVSTSLSRVGRKRNLESNYGNSVSPSENKSDSIEEHTRRRASKKVKNMHVEVAPTSEMVQIDTLIRSLPDDSGILLKPCGKDDSNFKCPKCNKVFRNPKLGSVHYSICPKNIELSKNRKTLVSPCNVVWVCSLCHLYFNQHSKLTKHKEICLLPMTSKLPFRRSQVGDEYKSSSKKCPKCCYQCISLIKFQNHPCKENLKKMKSCAIAMDKLPVLYVNSRGNFQYFECHQCKKPFFDEPSFREHLQLHPALQSNECVKTLNIKSRCPTTQIKAEASPTDFVEYANDNEQSNSHATLNNHSNSFIPSSTARPQNQSPTTNSLQSRDRVPSSNHQRGSVNNSYLETFFSSGSSSSFLHPSETSGSQTAESQARDIFTEDFLSSVQASELNFHLMNRGICRHHKQAVPPGEDVKPCMRCLEKIIEPDPSHDIAKVKQEMAEAMRRREEEDALEIDEAPLSLDPDPPNTINPDLDLLGYGNSEIAMQLMKDISAIMIPLSSHRFLTPPATPDRSNVRSPSSLGSAPPKKSHAQSRDSEAGPSGLKDSHSLNDLVSISLDMPFTTSEGFIAPFNKDAQSHLVNDPAMPEPALIVDEPLKIVDEPTLVAAEPLLMVDEPAQIAVEPLQMADEPAQMAAEPLQMVDEHAQIAAEPLQMVDEPAQIAAKPLQMVDEPAQIAAEALQIADEPMLIVGEPRAIVDEPLPITVEHVAMADDSMPIEPGLIIDIPRPIIDEPMAIAVEPVPLVVEPVVQEPFPALEIEPAHDEQPPPTVRHTHVPFGDLVADAFAMIPNLDTETVSRYICRHCLLTFQLDTLVTHMYSEAGKPTTEDILAVYIVE